MARQLIPRISPAMLKHNPDQVTEILNRAIDEINFFNSNLDILTGEIIDLKRRVTDLETNPPTPPTPTGEWTQVVAFNSANMGTIPGMCLANVLAGYGIYTGSFPNARSDWESQIANGTLHTGTPPADIQVPVYADTGTADGHVVVWDRGVVWSDGVVIPEGLSYYSNVVGWGELCDGNIIVTPAT